MGKCVSQLQADSKVFSTESQHFSVSLHHGDKCCSALSLGSWGQELIIHGLVINIFVCQNIIPKLTDLYAKILFPN